MLKTILESLDGISADVQGLYKKGADGKFHLEVEDDGELKAKNDEFRLTNIKLKKLVQDLEQKFAGMDPDEYRALKEKLSKIDEKKLIEAGKIDEVVEQRISAYQKNVDAKVEALEKANKDQTADNAILKGKLEKVTIEGEVLKSINKYAVPRKEAIPDLLNRAKGIWKINEKGEPVAMMGDKPLYGKDGRSLLTFDEYAENLVKDAAHCFEETKGTGTKGADGKIVKGGKIDPEVWKTMSPTEKLKQAREPASK